jgi:osmotically-inducible protein OsmY
MNTRIVRIAGILAVTLSAILVRPVLAVEKPNDDTITMWVNSALFEDPRVVSSGIKASTVNGVVTLTGTVRNLAEKRYADLEAMKIKGVRGVLDKLEVQPAHRSDTDITQEVRRRIINSSVIRSGGVGVQVLQGNVTLTGIVPSYSEVQQAELLASEVPGVKAVQNDMVVSFVSQRPDADIQGDVQARVNRDVFLLGLPINVSVSKGVVTLTGQVGNAYQLIRAGEDALWINNVKTVKNDLAVVWWKEQGVREQPPAPSDAELAASVHTELDEDLGLWDPWDITVTAQAGHVTLRGTVPTYYQKQMADQDAKDVVGVAWVSNLLQAGPEQRDDLAILDDATFNINTDYALLGEGIHVRVKDGIATLSGDVNTSFERAQATRDVAGVLGVADVVNNIKVNWQPKYGDTAIKGRIEDRLAANWETWPVLDRVKVTVTDGKATLTGSVDTWGEYGEAARVAFLTDGTRAVDNELKVDGAPYAWDQWYIGSPTPYAYDPYRDRDDAFYHQMEP